MKTFYSKAEELRSEIVNTIYPVIIEKRVVEFELNYNKGTVEVLKDDFSTVWVKYSKYNCKFEELPMMLMSLIADCVVNI